MGKVFAGFIVPGGSSEYEVRTQSCFRCLRFYKVALKEKSSVFRYLNDRINPFFDVLIERIVPLRVSRRYLLIKDHYWECAVPSSFTISLPANQRLDEAI
jgi:hypothetical protein